ncbi:MAG: hypothetical protein ACP5UD_07760 [Conexivisphaera sp.]
MRAIYRRTPRGGKLLRVEEADARSAGQRLVKYVAQTYSSLAGGSSRIHDGSSLLADVLATAFVAPLFLPFLITEPRETSHGGPEAFSAYVFGRHFEGRKFFEDVAGDLHGALGRLRRYALQLTPQQYRDLEFVYRTLSNVPISPVPGLNFIPLSSFGAISSAVGWATGSPDPALRIAALCRAASRMSGTPACRVLKAELGNLGALDDGLSDALGRSDELSDEDPLMETYMKLAGDVLSRSGLPTGCAELLNCRDSCPDGIDMDLYFECSERAREAVEDAEGELAGGESGTLVYVNFPGIGRFMRSFHRLRDYSASSSLVDFAALTVPFAILDEASGDYPAPPEAVLVGYGGHSLMAARIPRGRAEEEVKGRASDIYHVLDVDLEVGDGPLVVGGLPAPGHVRSKIVERAKLASLRHLNPGPLSYGLHETCESCGERPAVELLNGEALCRRCAEVRRASSSWGLGVRVHSTYRVSSGERTMELRPTRDSTPESDDIAGALSSRSGYMALFRFDGNNMSSYFRELRDLIEYSGASMWLDYSVKASLRKTLIELGEKAYPAAAGTIFLGGDEGLMAMPPGLAIRLAPSFLAAAERELNVTFKSAILVAKFTHPIQLLSEAAEKLSSEAKGDTTSTNVAVLWTAGIVTASSLHHYLAEWGPCGMKMYSPSMPVSRLESMLGSDWRTLRRMLESLLLYVETGTHPATGSAWSPSLDVLALMLLREAVNADGKGVGDVLMDILGAWLRNGTLNMHWYLMVAKALESELEEA